MNSIILTRNKNLPAVKMLYSIASRYTSCKIVENPPRPIDGYNQLCTIELTKDNLKTTAWDAAFFGIDKTKYTWFIEDDVCFTEGAFKKLVDNTANNAYDLIALNIKNKKNSSDWPWWKIQQKQDSLQYNWKSFNPLCRLSPSLIEKVLNYREFNTTFTFHEILFASLAETRFDMTQIEELSFKYFQWRTFIPNNIKNIDDYIFHPVKDQFQHSKISNINNGTKH